MYTMLIEELRQDNAQRQATTAFYIEHGFCESWAQEHKTESDEGLKRYSTATRWEQYQAGTITRAQAVEFAIKRNAKALAKALANDIEKLDRISKAPQLERFGVWVNWKKSSAWGYNPTATATVDTEHRFTRHTGTASGCGYDKESSAIAQALNDNDSIRRALCDYKEAQLQAGKVDTSSTACTGRDNRDIIGYGAGYAVIPYLEGGVGAGCFWSIFKKLGFEVLEYHDKKADSYTVYRA